MSNPFYTGEDVDDDAFLNHSRTGNKGYMLSNNDPYSSGTGQAAGGAPDPLQQLMDRKREIEQRTLDSSNRSVSLLYESEKTGQATAEELLRQKEQLKQTESRLNDINSTLKQSERHLQGIKSVFGGIRNYFRGGNAPAAGARPATASNSASASSAAAEMAVDSSMNRLDGMRESSHPGLRVQGRMEGQASYRSTSDEVNAALDRNLDEMSMGLSRLKGLAQNLNSELEDQNDLIDRIDNSAAIAGLKINRQNKDMDKLLKK